MNIIPVPGSPVARVDINATESIFIILPEGFFLNGAHHHYPVQPPGAPAPTYAGTPLGGDGGWYGSGVVRYHKRRYESPTLIIQTKLALDGEDLNIDLTVRNLSGATWDMWSYANVCYKPYMLDPSGGGLTHVYRNGATPTVGSIVAIPQDGPYPGQFGLWFSRPEAQPDVHGPFIYRRDPASTRHTGIGWNKICTVGGNFHQGSCIHASPYIGVSHGDSMSASGRIVMDAPTLGVLFDKFTIV